MDRCDPTWLLLPPLLPMLLRREVQGALRTIRVSGEASKASRENAVEAPAEADGSIPCRL